MMRGRLAVTPLLAAYAVLVVPQLPAFVSLVVRAEALQLGELAARKWSVAVLSTVGVVISTAVVGLLTWGVLNVLGIPARPIYCATAAWWWSSAALRAARSGQPPARSTCQASRWLAATWPAPAIASQQHSCMAT